VRASAAAHHARENPGVESMASIGSMRNDHFRAASAIRKLHAASFDRIELGATHVNKGDKSWAREASRGGKLRPLWVCSASLARCVAKASRSASAARWR